MAERFTSLITDFCRTVNLGDPANIMKGAPFETDEVVFAFHYDKNRPDSVRIYTDFGAPPPKKKKLIYYALLEENFITAIGSTGTLGVSSMTGNVVYTEQIDISTMTVEKLCSQLMRLAEQARTWRVTHYIGDFAEPVARPRSPGSIHRQIAGKSV